MKKKQEDLINKFIERSRIMNELIALSFIRSCSEWNKSHFTKLNPENVANLLYEWKKEELDQKAKADKD